MIEYKIITGSIDTVITQINTHLKDGWRVHGSLSTTTVGQYVTHSQPIIRDIALYPQFAA